MANHGSATVREHTSHANQTRTNRINNALKRRAQARLNDKSIDPQSRAILRYALEINDPWLAELVRRAEAGEAVGDTLNFEETCETNNDEASAENGASTGKEASAEKIEALTELICRAGDEPRTKSAALLVLMASIENSSHPKALANTVQHLALTCCGELNHLGVVDAQIAVVERELLATRLKL